MKKKKSFNWDRAKLKLYKKRLCAQEEEASYENNATFNKMHFYLTFI